MTKMKLFSVLLGFSLMMLISSFTSARNSREFGLKERTTSPGNANYARYHVVRISDLTEGLHYSCDVGETSLCCEVDITAVPNVPNSVIVISEGQVYDVLKAYESSIIWQYQPGKTFFME